MGGAQHLPPPGPHSTPECPRPWEQSQRPSWSLGPHWIPWPGRECWDRPFPWEGAGGGGSSPCAPLQAGRAGAELGVQGEGGHGPSTSSRSHGPVPGGRREHGAAAPAQHSCGPAHLAGAEGPPVSPRSRTGSPSPCPGAGRPHGAAPTGGTRPAALPARSTGLAGIGSRWNRSWEQRSWFCSQPRRRLPSRGAGGGRRMWGSVTRGGAQ